MNSKEQIEVIRKYCPELQIENNEGAWDWVFRNDESAKYDDASGGFVSPLEALAHFTTKQIEACYNNQPNKDF